MRRQCGVCAVWVRPEEGFVLPSGNRNERTGETPCDNFVCRECVTEAGRNWWVTKQIECMSKPPGIGLAA